MNASSGRETMRFGLIGCGVIAPTHARALAALADRGELVACADIVPARAQAFAEEFGIEAMDVADLLADARIEAVVVCTPSGTHADVGVPALLAGKHVIVEKPMDITLEACDRLLDAQRRTGATLAVISQHRFDRASQVAATNIRDGALGRIVLADCAIPWFRTQEYYDADAWRGTWAQDGGGALMNQGVHTLDLLRWTCGPVSTVYAQARTAAHTDIEVEDAVCATVSFASGAIATVLATTAAYPGFPARLAVHGTEGSVVLEGDGLATLAIRGRPVEGGETARADALDVATGGTRAATRAVDAASAAEAPDAAEAWGEAHRRQIADFIDAVRRGRPPLVDGVEGRNAVELVHAIYASARSGRAVDL